MEVLVILAILSILAGILFPTFSHARSVARSAACQSNLRQLGLAIQMYAQDFDDQLVRAAVGDPARGGYGRYTFPDGETRHTDQVLWGHLIYPYVRNTRVYSCPESDYQYTGGYEPYGGYSGNPLVFGLPIVALEHPSETLVVLDAGDSHPGQAEQGCSCPAGPYGPLCRHYYMAWWGDGFCGIGTTVNPRHHGFANVLFLDGRVQPLRREQLTGPQPFSRTDGHPLWRPFRKAGDETASEASPGDPWARQRFQTIRGRPRPNIRLFDRSILLNLR